ncbi:MAG: alternative ribosome rescue aminoacyl-tRNA hydrolase ArfB [Bacteroidota bacterium]
MNKQIIEQEITYKAIRSGGKGGQNVNKVATCVQLYFDINNTQAFDENCKNRLLAKLVNRISSDGVLMLDCSETRSQLKNKELVLKKFYIIIQNALIEQKKRIKTNTPVSVKLKRLSDKKNRSELKSMRKFDYRN